MKTLSALLLLLFVSSAYSQTNCLQTAKEVAPQLSAETKRDFDAKLAQAAADYATNPNADSSIWLGRRTAYLGQYKDAIKIYTEAIERFPRDARLYRHRGHRFITLRCFDDAVSDFETAGRLIKGKRDEMEPDGLPNARNIRTSTLQSNIWYHLGLVYYLKGDFTRALAAYRQAMKVSRNPDMLVATTHWVYMTLRRLDQPKQADASLSAITDHLEVIENGDYLQLIRLYQSKLQLADVLNEGGASADTLSNATAGYGVGNWLFYNGLRPEAEKIWRRVTNGNQWASFGYIAAEAELNRLAQQH